PLPLDRPLPWVEGWDLLREEACWVPLDLVSLNSVPPAGGGWPLGQNTNGLASGNLLVEALLHGLYECIDRDAATLWFADEKSPAEATQVALASITDPTCAALIDRLAAAGQLIAIYDNTSDVGVPSYQCLISDRPGALRNLGYFWGFGCHL